MPEKQSDPKIGSCKQALRKKIQVTVKHVEKCSDEGNTKAKSALKQIAESQEEDESF